MKKTKKPRSKEEKLKILKEASTNGVRQTLEKYGVYPATYYSWRKKYDSMGEDGLSHSMTKERLARIKELEQEVDCLKQLLAEERLESKLKDELLKKEVSQSQKKVLVMEHMALGMKRDKALDITGITKHQYYYDSRSEGRRGRSSSTHTVHVDGATTTEVSNDDVIRMIKENQEDPDLDYGYKRMTSALQLAGYHEVSPKNWGHLSKS